MHDFSYYYYYNFFSMFNSGIVILILLTTVCVYTFTFTAHYSFVALQALQFPSGNANLVLYDIDIYICISQVKTKSKSEIKTFPSSPTANLQSDLLESALRHRLSTDQSLTAIHNFPACFLTQHHVWSA